MSNSLKTTAKCAAQTLAQFIASQKLRTTWLFDVRTVLGLTQESMAAALGEPRRTYQYWEADARRMPPEKCLLLDRFLAERNLDSRGRMRVAQKVG